MTELKNCPNCEASLKSGLMSSNTLHTEMEAAIINEYHEPKSEGYCTKCAKELLPKYSKLLLAERDGLGNEIQRLIGIVPIISIHTPLNWDYEVVGMVTGQSTTGTGVITEFASSITDIFGAQSGRHNNKLKAGEDMCFMQLRKNAINLGANAVIATDIDYAEVGSGKGILMVCMAGTAVNLKNIDIMGNGKGELLDKLIKINKRMKWLLRYTIAP
ncbi:heavy metal-binding domain-containing protein [Cryomorpha ignava]|uniref:Heavy metal-binding domain-containing protein n=1 Tax=Cryomorpha ignava TaxID=101383 RepID=A0A7K3WUM4_9FLAO|nr:heavy metal-binding domain-containing protein [Cryomorpha ignava]NEN25360.1 heavy metal-binding domain-containing protein [Cryomorpha ignava]